MVTFQRLLETMGGSVSEYVQLDGFWEPSCKCPMICPTEKAAGARSTLEGRYQVITPMLRIGTGIFT